MDYPSCLVVEDQALIGMAIEAYLEDAGLEVCGPVASAADALQVLNHDAPAFVILDYMLKDGPCEELILELKRRGVPFIVYSGHERDVRSHPALMDVPWLEKPADRKALLRAVAAAAPAVLSQADLPVSVHF